MITKNMYTYYKEGVEPVYPILAHNLARHLEMLSTSGDIEAVFHNLTQLKRQILHLPTLPILPIRIRGRHDPYLYPVFFLKDVKQTNDSQLLLDIEYIKHYDVNAPQIDPLAP